MDSAYSNSILLVFRGSIHFRRDASSCGRIIVEIRDDSESFSAASIFAADSTDVRSADTFEVLPGNRDISNLMALSV